MIINNINDDYLKKCINQCFIDINYKDFRYFQKGYNFQKLIKS